MALCLRDPSLERYGILAIQEPWLNLFTPTTHHLLKSKFRLYYLDPFEIDGAARVCFFVNKKMQEYDIDCVFHSADLVTLQICLVDHPASGKHYVQIHNVYNQPKLDPSPVMAELEVVLSTNSILNMSTTGSSSIEHIVLGDFNIHHLT